MPLVRSWWLGKKKGKEAYVVHRVVGGKVELGIGHDPKYAPTAKDDGTVGRTGATCVHARRQLPSVTSEGKAYQGRSVRILSRSSQKASVSASTFRRLPCTFRQPTSLSRMMAPTAQSP